MINSIVVCSVIAVGTYVLFGLLKLKQTERFLLGTQDSSPFDESNVQMVILMPVLREQEIINENLKIFSNLKGNYELIYITSDKEEFQKSERRLHLESLIEKVTATESLATFLELLSGFFPRSTAKGLFGELQSVKREDQRNYILKRYDELPSTSSLIEAYLLEGTYPHVRQINYPETNGVMAHQLNYALQNLSKTHDPGNTYVLIYNADSVVPKNALDIFRSKIALGEDVILQSSLFLENYDLFPRSWRGDIMRFVALAQSRWTLLHEIPRVRRQHAGHLSGFFESAHVVGHGTCASLKALLEVEGYPQGFTNEDLALGYFLALKGYKISSLQSLENSQSPSTIKDIINQYKTWFYGAADYFDYCRYAIRKLDVSTTQARLWATVNTIKALVWLLAPWVWLILTISAVQVSVVWGLVMVGLFFIHTSFCHVV